MDAAFTAALLVVPCVLVGLCGVAALKHSMEITHSVQCEHTYSTTGAEWSANACVIGTVVLLLNAHNVLLNYA
jgi:hypothetical protein